MSDHREYRGPKLFVLDTNVILHDCGCLRSFKDNDVAVPITVLEELDRFKRGNEDINFQAREFLRCIDELTGDLLSQAGATIGPDSLQLPVSKEQIRVAPNLEVNDLSQADESRLYHHYQLNYTPLDTESGRRLARR